MGSYFYVYMYIDPDTRKPFYIGKGQRARAWSFTGHNHNKWVISKINNIIKRGYKSKDFVVLLEENLTEEEAFQQESILIEQYGKKIDGGMLFNVNNGGLQPPSQKGKRWKMSRDGRENIKKSWTAERRIKNSKKFKTIERTAEWCERISISKRKIIFNQQMFEHLVKDDYKLKDIIDQLNITYDIFRDRALTAYKTVKFRDIKKLISNI
jgi:hypothetical protein